MDKYSGFVLHLEHFYKCKKDIKEGEGVSMQK